MSAGTAYIVTSMMESVIKEGTGYPNAVIDRPAAGKTGTTSSRTATRGSSASPPIS